MMNDLKNIANAKNPQKTNPKSKKTIRKRFKSIAS